jgi:hypothetical protein
MNMLRLMRRLGMHELIGDAERRLPDPVDFGRDALLLIELGLEFDMVVDRLGGSPW